jgi:hypothetical protein
MLYVGPSEARVNLEGTIVAEEADFGPVPAELSATVLVQRASFL